MESNELHLAWAGMGDHSGWHRGVSWYPIEIIGETPKRYRDKAVMRMPLPSRPGRLRGTGIGDEFLVPKRAVSLARPEEFVREARNRSPFVRPALLVGYENEMEELPQHESVHESARRWILEAAKQEDGVLGAAPSRPSADPRRAPGGERGATQDPGAAKCP